MKKIYFAPETKIVEVVFETVMTSTSSIQGGDDWHTGEGASRESDWED